MEKIKSIEEINKELKIMINEASFNSIKCRNKILKIFNKVFSCNLDISNYKNVDLKITDNLEVIYRQDKYKISEDIKTHEDFYSKYEEFLTEANKIIDKNNVNFDNIRLKNNIINLIIVFALIVFIIVVIYFCIKSFLGGDFYNLLWFLVFIVPYFVPRLKESLGNRIIQARNFIKTLFRKK